MCDLNLLFHTVYLGKKTSQLRLRIALRTDERVRLMNEVSMMGDVKVWTLFVEEFEKI